MDRIDPSHGGLASPPTPPDVNREFRPVASSLSLEEKLSRCLSVGEECIQPDELLALLATKPHPLCYDGFEPSGKMHIAQGILKSLNVNKLTSSGCIFIFWVADWFALLNNKLGGDLCKIQTVGKYMIETWRAAGMDMRNVKFLWASEEINKQPNEYWLRVMDIARKNTVNRMTRCSQIMGREESGDLSSAQIMYPCMQCADIFFLGADICQLGMDQRKVNVLAREYCDDIKRTNKPVILSHTMMMGLLEGQEKMSKTDLRSAIFMQDSAEEVENKIKSAYCRPGDVTTNPILNYTKHIILEKLGELTVRRSQESGGDQVYRDYEELATDFAEDRLHPGDLKPAVARALNELLEPVRRHFTENEYARGLLAQVQGFQVTK